MGSRRGSADSEPPVKQSPGAANVRGARRCPGLPVPVPGRGGAAGAGAERSRLIARPPAVGWAGAAPLRTEQLPGPSARTAA